jgi:hypothetical protein
LVWGGLGLNEKDVHSIREKVMGKARKKVWFIKRRFSPRVFGNFSACLPDFFIVL